MPSSFADTGSSASSPGRLTRNTNDIASSGVSPLAADDPKSRTVWTIGRILIDPKAVPWRGREGIDAKRKRDSHTFQLVYQQDDYGQDDEEDVIALGRDLDDDWDDGTDSNLPYGYDPSIVLQRRMRVWATEHGGSEGQENSGL